MCGYVCHVVVPCYFGSGRRRAWNTQAPVQQQLVFLLLIRSSVGTEDEILEVKPFPHPEGPGPRLQVSKTGGIPHGGEDLCHGRCRVSASGSLPRGRYLARPLGSHLPHGDPLLWCWWWSCGGGGGDGLAELRYADKKHPYPMTHPWDVCFC